jgi:periplasmic divalent cation tolerance protein
MSHIIVFSACASRREAGIIARQLLRERLAACVNLVAISSLYWWKGEVRNGSEWLLVIKTRTEMFEALKRRVCELNSYDVPEIVSVKINRGSPAYLHWIDQETHA